MTKAVKILIEDHERFRELYRRFDETEIFSVQVEIFHELAARLKAHSAVEEELFYPAVRRISGQEDLIEESLQEHHVLDLLVQEILDMSPSDEHGQEEYRAKVRVLWENLEHHVEEEELEMFPKAEEAGLDEDNALAKAMWKQKEALDA